MQFCVFTNGKKYQLAGWPIKIEAGSFKFFSRQFEVGAALMMAHVHLGAVSNGLVVVLYFADVFTAIGIGMKFVNHVYILHGAYISRSIKE